MIRTKCILEPLGDYDGLRISVMNRYTLNDGITPDLRINDSSYDIWLPWLAPPNLLLGDYYKRELPWEQFEKRYRNYIEKPWIVNEIQKIASRSLNSDITLLCIEGSPEYCHRRILAEECQKYEPSLDIYIK